MRVARSLEGLLSEPASGAQELTMEIYSGSSSQDQSLAVEDFLQADEIYLSELMPQTY